MNCLIKKSIKSVCDTQVSGLKKIEISNVNDNNWFDVPFHGGSAGFNITLNKVNDDLSHFTHTLTGTLSMYQQDVAIIKEYSLADVKFRVTDKNNNVYILGEDGMQATQFDYNSGSAPTDTVGLTFTFEGHQRDVLKTYKEQKATFSKSHDDFFSNLFADGSALTGSQPFVITIDYGKTENGGSISEVNTPLFYFSNFVITYDSIGVGLIYRNRDKLYFPIELNSTSRFIIEYEPAGDLTIHAENKETGYKETMRFYDTVLNNSINNYYIYCPKDTTVSISVEQTQWRTATLLPTNGERLLFPKNFPVDRKWNIYISITTGPNTTSEIISSVSNPDENGVSLSVNNNGSNLIGTLKGKGIGTLTLNGMNEELDNDKLILGMRYTPNDTYGLRVVYPTNYLSLVRNSELNEFKGFNYNIDRIMSVSYWVEPKN